MQTPYQMIDKDVLGGNTGALYNKQVIHEETNLSTPSEDNVIEAKEWVDNGSRL
ncbi:MAG: CDIF630_02480 family spore surface protein [Cellulosilyticaceae bacterium]